MDTCSIIFSFSNAMILVSPFCFYFLLSLCDPPVTILSWISILMLEQFSKRAKNLPEIQSISFANRMVYRCMEVWNKHCKWFENSPKYHKLQSGQWYFGRRYQSQIPSRNHVSLGLSYKEYSTTVIFACKVSNLAEIPLVFVLTFQKFLSLYYKNIAI